MANTDLPQRVETEIKEILSVRRPPLANLRLLDRLSTRHRNKIVNDGYKSKTSIALVMLHTLPDHEHSRCLKIAKSALNHAFPDIGIHPRMSLIRSKGILANIYLAIAKIVQEIPISRRKIVYISANIARISRNYTFCINFIRKDNLAIDVNVNKLSQFRNLGALHDHLRETGDGLGHTVSEYMIHEFGHVVVFIDKEGSIRDKLFWQLTRSKPNIGISGSDYSRTNNNEFLAEAFYIRY